MNFRSIWKNIRYRILIITAGLLFLFFLVVLIFADPILNNLVKDNLVVKANSGYNTTLHIDDMSYHLFSNSVEATGIRLLYKDSSLTGISTYDIIIPSFEISGINWAGVIFGSGLSLRTIIIDRPVLQIKSESHENQQNEKKDEGNEKQKHSPLFEKSFISGFPSRINPLYINKLEIRSGKLFRNSKTDDETIKDTISNFNLGISGIMIDSTLSDSSLTYIIAQNFQIDAQNIVRKYVEGGNILAVDSLSASGKDSLLTIKKFSYRPFLSRKDYFARKKYRADRRIIKIADLEMKGIDFGSVVQRSIFTASSAVINDFFVEILTDKRKAISPSYAPKMPNEILRSMNFGININKLKFTRGIINVEALQENSDTAAVLPFSKVSAEIFNLGNLKRSNQYAVIRAEGNMFKAAQLSLQVHLDQKSKELNYTCKGKLDSMDVQPMNQWLEIDELVRITNGHTSKIDFNSEMQNGKAHAIVTPVYENLELKMLNKKKEEKKIKTFLAKIFTIRKNNPEDGKLKTGQEDYVGTDDNTFFDELWIPVKKALGEVVGY